MKRFVCLAVLAVCFLFPALLPLGSGAGKAAAKTKLNKSSATLQPKETLQLKLSGTKSRASWSSSDASVASVNQSGKVTAKKAGTAIVTAKVGNSQYTCEITVKVLYLSAPDAPETIPKKLECEHITPKIVHVKGMHRLFSDYSTWGVDQIKSRVENFNRVLDSLPAKVQTYLYFVESSRSHPIALSFPEDSEVYTYLKNNLHVKKTDHLKYKTFKQMCSYFYATDHHWNYRGSYQGYVDIVRMIKGKKEPVLKPSGVVTTSAIYNGSYCLNSGTSYSNEHFSFYRFSPLPSYTHYFKEKKKSYGHLSSYLNGKYSDQPFTNHYSNCYGACMSFSRFEASHPGKGKLLVICDSMACAVLPLLTHHFDTVIAVDLRDYEQEFGKPFSVKEMIRTYRIDQVLFLGNNTVFSTGEAMVP